MMEIVRDRLALMARLYTHSLQLFFHSKNWKLVSKSLAKVCVKWMCDLSFKGVIWV